MHTNNIYPFAAVIGQQKVKNALLIALVNRKAGGLLIGGRKGTAKTVLARSCRQLIGDQKIIDVPLNITEDMLFGSIDIEVAVSKGQKRFAPGILSRANDNMLYIDEANLLRQELLTAILDANTSGINIVERDGISFSHEVRLTVIATMNPEEGSLPGHILDRFGMYVDVGNEYDIDVRIAIMRAALEYEFDRKAFCEKYAEETQTLAKEIADARALLPKVELNEAMMILAAKICMRANCAGHRAEIYLLEAARAVAALASRTYVLPKDVEAAAEYVLPHRMRMLPPGEQPQDEQQQQEEPSADSQNQEGDEVPEAETDQERQALPPMQNGDDFDDEAKDRNFDNQPRGDKDQLNRDSSRNLAPEEQIADIDKGFHMPKMVLDLGKDRILRRGSGKRSSTKTDLKQGRYVRAELPKGKVEDLAFDATIRAAAPFQSIREDNGCALNIQKEDLRQKVREKRIGNTFLFAVDASGSMGARERMKAVKGAIFYMLQEAYQKRDRVGMVAFRRQSAEVLLPITRSVDLAQKRLAEMPTGGKTPLADGLATSLMTLSMLSMRDDEMQPIMILITDGRANATDKDHGNDPVEAAMKIAEKFRKAKITSVVIDTESGFIKLGLAKKIAAAMGASYFPLKKLSQDNIIHIVRNIGD